MATVAALLPELAAVVPTISEQIVTQEPTNQKQQKLTTDPPTPAPYTDPTFKPTFPG